MNSDALEKLSNVQIYADIILGILRYTTIKGDLPEDDFLIRLAKKLKFQNTSGVDLLRACIDQIQDAQSAIDSYNNFGLYKNEEDTNEMYLRLYGLLNACYLQMGAIIDLIRIFNFINQKEIKSTMKSLKIIELRNKIASHTTNYHYGDNKTFGFFRLVQTSLSKWGDKLLIIGKERGENETFDITKILFDFTKELEIVLNSIVEKELYSRKFRQDLFEWMKQRHDFLKSSNND